MLNETKSNAERTLSTDEIIRQVKERYRICNYLFRAGVIWILIGTVSVVLPVLFGADHATLRVFGRIFWLSEAIGWAIFTSALAVTFAIYRCPACDCYLSRFRPDKLRCPNCDAQVRIAV